MKQLMAIDFEFNKPAEPDMGLISCSLHSTTSGTMNFWLKDATEKQRFLDLLYSIRSSHCLVGYEIQLAEARCLAALGLDPNEWDWRDLIAEWRWLRNETNKYKYGKIVKKGKPYFTVPPIRRVLKRMTSEEQTEAEELNSAHLQAIQFDMDEGETAAFDEAGYSMLDCCYFFELIDFDQYIEGSKIKSEVRDSLIIGGTDAEIERNREKILTYNASDVQDLVALAQTIEAEIETVLELPHVRCYNGEIEKDTPAVTSESVMLSLGEWCARLAKYAQRGIPLNTDRLNTFMEIVPKLTQEIKEAWNRDHSSDPLYRVGLSESMLSKKRQSLKRSPYIEGVYTKDAMYLQKIIANHCRESGIDNWPKTRNGGYMADSKCLSTFASGENIIKQLQRHQGQLSNLKAFSEDKSGNVDAFRFIGSDGKQRPDFGPFGTQTARNAHKAKSLLFANAHWMRILIDPEPGMAIVEVDYTSEEVFIAAAISGDQNMKDAYLSNDVYMYFAQLSGMYPSNLPIPTEEQRDEEWFKPYKTIRQIAKSTVLGIQFGMGRKTLATTVALASKTDVDQEQAQELIDGYREAYPDYNNMVSSLKIAYQDDWNVMLESGWRLGVDSPSILSVCNVPVQGTGSEILRLACRKLDAVQIPVIATMHDSITAYCEEQYAEAIAEEMSLQMVEAADEVLGIKGMKVGAPEIIRHGDWWLHGKGYADWPKYKQHFIKEDVK